MKSRLRQAFVLMFCALSSASGCSDEHKDVIDDAGPSKSELTVGSISYVLDGTFAPYVHERMPAVLSAVGNTPVDLLCINQVMTDEDKQAIAAASKDSFPYAVWVASDAETEIGDPRALDGQVPPMPTEAPCEPADLAPLAKDAVDCIQNNCALEPGDPSSSMVAGPCAAEKCVAPMAKLMWGETAAHKRCYACLLYTLMSSTPFDETYATCTTYPKAGFAFGGNNGNMLLSKVPLVDASLWVLPSTAWNEAVLSARAQLPSGGNLDVHCTVLQGPHNASTQPYVGRYGGDGEGNDAWANETLLQAHRLVERIRDISAGHRAVLLGDLYTGPSQESEAGTVLSGVNPDAFEVLADALTLGVVDGYEPQCTLCDENPLVLGDGSSNAWTAHIFLSGMPDTVVVETSRFATEPVVDVEGEQGPLKVPISPRYGLRSVLEIPQ